MVRMAFSPRDIWGTPSSQPIHQISKLKAILHKTYILKRTADETTDTDGGGKGTTAGLAGGIESMDILVKSR
jgi:hypothetical protein